MWLSCKILGEEITPGDAKNFFAIISNDLWNGIADDDDEEMMKEKVINFLNPFHVACQKCKRIF